MKLYLQETTCPFIIVRSHFVPYIRDINLCNPAVVGCLSLSFSPETEMYQGQYTSAFVCASEFALNGINTTTLTKCKMKQSFLMPLEGPRVNNFSGKSCLLIVLLRFSYVMTLKDHGLGSYLKCWVHGFSSQLILRNRAKTRKISSEALDEELIKKKKENAIQVSAKRLLQGKRYHSDWKDD